ncbi:ribosomal protein S18-alanine N-acetyltransferase [Cognatilysobacter lacus]|uniref:[Ribosomal protein bS18]-alanine N-acetyltransferase n=1 Tax=Cognatilysobacter lacus TaxID=1643323 RepID=A0A5D8Z8U7_9GAMM|nr:ribosomal protein S18-alanine N-acetyltransferase [Lysobacter lacus]TZF91259.1 ribosomal-protein-alanine N-acetyltransferase [Lysobacter lacus]
MSARPSSPGEVASLRPMREQDVDGVFAVERRSYEFPWTAGIFRDCLRADYIAWVLDVDGAIAGYFLVSLAAGEAHVLNICVAPEHQGRGHGKRLLRALLHVARSRGAQRVFLEVRPSNRGAIAMYDKEGFNEIGRRPRYYPARDGREDAVVMAMELLPPD